MIDIFIKDSHLDLVFTSDLVLFGVDWGEPEGLSRISAVRLRLILLKEQHMRIFCSKYIGQRGAGFHGLHQDAGSP